MSEDRRLEAAAEALCTCCGFPLDAEEQAMLADEGEDVSMCSSCNTSQGTAMGQQA